MKRNLVIVVLVAAMVFGTVAYANAANVTVNASVNPKFEMTLDTDGVVNFGPVDIGTSTTKAADEQFTIKSNKLWDFSAEAIAGTWDGQAASTYLSVATTSSKDGNITGGKTGAARGTSTLTADYTLDMTPASAWDLPAETALAATITYTAVQQ